MENQPPVITEDATRPFDGEPTPIAFGFAGRGLDFFHIWIVNLLLTAITLGLYLPWARVRVKRFFYEHTRLGEEPFAYLADPRRIFKAYLLVIAAYLVLLALELVDPVLSTLGWVAVVLIIPWLIVKMLRFAARNSAYRGIRFRFNGSTGESYFLFLLAPLLTVLSLGIAAPYFHWRRHRFYATGHFLGSDGFQFDATIPSYYRVFLGTVLIAAAGGAILFAAMFSFTAGISAVLSWPGVIAASAVIFYALTYFRTRLYNLRWSGTSYRGYSFQAALSVKDLFLLSIKNSVLTLLTLGLYYPVAQVRFAALYLDALEFESAEVVENIRGLAGEEEGALGEASDALLDFDIA